MSVCSMSSANTSAAVSLAKHASTAHANARAMRCSVCSRTANSTSATASRSWKPLPHDTRNLVSPKPTNSTAATVPARGENQRAPSARSCAAASATAARLSTRDSTSSSGPACATSQK